MKYVYRCYDSLSDQLKQFLVLSKMLNNSAIVITALTADKKQIKCKAFFISKYTKFAAYLAMISYNF